MAKSGVFSRFRRFEKGEEGGLGDSFSDSHEVHVLAVDDSLVDRKVIERLLKITSCKVTAVDSGMRALQFLGLDEDKSSVGFDGLKVDLIITDYCMPGMTGYDLLKKIKGSSNFQKIPVVIVSSENILARIDRCLEEGAEDFIVKPVKLSDIKRLKKCMFGENQVQTLHLHRGVNKRKLEDNSQVSLCTSSLDELSSSPSPPSISSPSSPSSFTSLPSSPSSPTSPEHA